MRTLTTGKERSGFVKGTMKPQEGKAVMIYFTNTKTRTTSFLIKLNHECKAVFSVYKRVLLLSHFPFSSANFSFAIFLSCVLCVRCDLCSFFLSISLTPRPTAFCIYSGIKLKVKIPQLSQAIYSVFMRSWGIFLLDALFIFSSSSSFLLPLTLYLIPQTKMFFVFLISSTNQKHSHNNTARKKSDTVLICCILKITTVHACW